MSTSGVQDPTLLEQPQNIMLLKQQNTTESERQRRLRTLTDGGQEIYEATVQRQTSKLIKFRRNIDSVIANFVSTINDRALVFHCKEQLKEIYGEYIIEVNALLRYLSSVNTEYSLREKASQEVIHNQIYEKVVSVYKGMERVLEQTEATPTPALSETLAKSKSITHTSNRSSNSSRISSKGSILARQRAKLEAAKTRLEFASREAELDKQKAKLEADVLRQRVRYESDLKFLKSQQEAAVAQAELNALCEELSDSETRSPRNVSRVNSKERTEKYVSEQNELLAAAKSSASIDVDRDPFTQEHSYSPIPRTVKEKTMPVSLSGLTNLDQHVGSATGNVIEPVAKTVGSRRPCFLSTKFELLRPDKVSVKKGLTSSKTYKF